MFVDVNLLHPNLERLVLIRVVFEMRQSGGVLPSLQLDVLQFIRYNTTTDLAKLVVECLVMLQVSAYCLFFLAPCHCP